MPTDLILSDRSQNSEVGPLSEIADRANEFVHHSKAENTIRAYRSDWAHFQAWCKAHDQTSLPASSQTVALYVTDLSTTHKTATITRRISAISQAHQIARFETPTQSSQVRLVLAGIRRTKGTAQAAKTPVLVDDLRRMISSLPDNLLGVRDRALLLVGFSGAFRRAELVALDCRCRHHQRRPCGHYPALQDGSRGRRSEDRDPIRQQPGSVSGTSVAGLVGSVRLHGRSTV
jgi:site-specific recombinase XerC